MEKFCYFICNIFFCFEKWLDSINVRKAHWKLPSWSHTGQSINIEKVSDFLLINILFIFYSFFFWNLQQIQQIDAIWPGNVISKHEWFTQMIDKWWIFDVQILNSDHQLIEHFCLFLSSSIQTGDYSLTSRDAKSIISLELHNIYECERPKIVLFKHDNMIWKKKSNKNRNCNNMYFFVVYSIIEWL